MSGATCCPVGSGEVKTTAPPASVTAPEAARTPGSSNGTGVEQASPAQRERSSQVREKSGAERVSRTVTPSLVARKLATCVCAAGSLHSTTTRAVPPAVAATGAMTAALMPQLPFAERGRAAAQ